MTTEQETLREILQTAYPAVEPSDALRQRVSTMAADATSTQIRQVNQRRRNSLRLLGAAATVLLILAFLLMPRLSAVLALARMANSLRDVRSLHSINWQVLPDGKRVKTNEQWYQAGNWRVEETGGKSVQICAGGERWTYSGGDNTVTLERAAFPMGYQGITGFSVTTSLRDAAAMGVLTNVQMLDSATIAGHAVHWIQISDNKYPDARSKIAVDDATDLPIQSETEERVHGQWNLASVRESQYGLPLAASLFTANFPKTARLVDVEAGRGIWRQRLAKGVAAQTRGNDGFTISLVKINGTVQARYVPLKGPRRVVIRDFQTNANGDVFLLFTNGTGVGTSDFVRDVDLVDDYGTKYISWEVRSQQGIQTATGPQPFTATCIDDLDAQNPSASKVNGYLFNDEELIGRWWVPLQPQGQNKPHHFTLTLHEDFNPGITVFHLPVEKPACAIVPEYMPYMARPLSGEWQIPHAEAMTRAQYYQNEGHDLPQALVWYQKAIALDLEDGRRSGEHLDEENEWFGIYQIQTQQGRTEEAKAALIKASQDAVYSSPVRDEIQAEMKKQGLDP